MEAFSPTQKRVALEMLLQQIACVSAPQALRRQCHPGLQSYPLLQEVALSWFPPQNLVARLHPVLYQETGSS